MTFDDAYRVGLMLAGANMLDSLEVMLQSRGCQSDELERVAKRVRDALAPQKPSPGPDMLPGRVTAWYRPEDYPDRQNWRQYLDLLHRKGWDEDKVINTINWTSSEILNHMPPPRPPEEAGTSVEEYSFQCYGLVVGYVQSGKTANFTAVAAKAADAGYDLVIVLAGLHNDLRSQTQLRLDKELTGKAQDPKGLHVAQPVPTWMGLTGTGEHEDFYDDKDVNSLDRDGPVLMVIKKRCSVLEKLDNWLTGEPGQESTTRRILAGKRLLLIDDEADYAGVNTGREREDGDEPDIDEVVADLEVDEEEARDTDPSRTNELIRLVLRHFSKKVYVGYTATPFANVLIDPFRENDELGPTLYPRDFIYSLPRPIGYCGAEQYFPFGAMVAQYRQRGVREVAPEDAELVREGGTVTDEPSDSLPQSLKDAMLDFVLTLAARRFRGQGDKHHSMLIHAHHHVAIQNDLYQKVARLWEVWRPEIDELARRPITPGAKKLENDLRTRWESEFRSLGAPEVWDQVRRHLSPASEVVVTVVNSSPPGPKNGLYRQPVSPPPLKYDDHPNGMKVIAIGGNRLSRGLTLEGLTVTYYVRPTRMYDTLLQMGRWFGFRPGYSDLVRIFVTDELRSWFSHLARVEQQIRRDISRYGEQQERTPLDLAVRILTHPEANGLMPTSPAKRRAARELRVGWDGTTTQTLHFHLGDTSILRKNLEQTRAFLDSLGEAGPGQLLWTNVDGRVILEYLRHMQFPEVEDAAFDLDLVRQYIEKRVADGELEEWSVFVPTVQGGRPLEREVLGHEIRLPKRSRLAHSRHESVGVLSDPPHFMVDMPGGAGAYDSTEKMFDVRTVQNGLLIIYVVDKDSSATDEDRVALFDGYPDREHVVGLAFAFPRSSKAEKDNFMCVKGVSYE